MTLVIKNINLCDEDSRYYNIYKTLIKSVKSYSDVKMLTEIYTNKIKNKTLIKIMDNSIDSYGSKTIIGIEDFFDIISSLNEYIYRDDARDFVQTIFKRTSDNIQRSLIIRIIGFLPPKMQKITMKDFNNKLKEENTMVRCCPHCQKMTQALKSTTYVVCGYNSKGYDWEGCQKDWCFRCGKKLCKNWYENDLCNEQNRYHDNNCCNEYASKNKDSYENYCDCDKMHINHRI